MSGAPITLPVQDARTSERRATSRLARRLVDHIGIEAKPPRPAAGDLFWTGIWRVSFRGQHYEIEVRVPATVPTHDGHERRVRRAAAPEIAVLEARAGRTEAPE